MVADTDSVDKLSIYLIDSSDMPSIYAFVKDMAVSFPQIDWLYLWFECPCKIVSFLWTVDDYNPHTDSKGYIAITGDRRRDDLFLHRFM